MVEVMNTDIKEPLEMRHCPVCQQATTMVHFTCLHKDEQMNILESDYRRCLRCLTLFTLKLDEIKEEHNGTNQS